MLHTDYFFIWNSDQTKRQKDIQSAKAFVGTCPDMCPEKERYDREDKRCLSVYEMVPGTENIVRCF